MFCAHCGTAIPPGSNFCPDCGRLISDDGRRAGVFIRAIALVIDAVVLFIPCWIFDVLTGTATSGGLQLQEMSFYFALVIGFGYYVYFESQRGATPGKMIMGLKVVMIDGSPCNVAAAAIRTICRLIDGILCYLIGALFIWFSVNKQRLGDRVAGTLVIKK